MNIEQTAVFLSFQERVVVLVGKVALKLRLQWLCILFFKLSIQYTYIGNESEHKMASAPAVWASSRVARPVQNRNIRGARNTLILS